MPRSSSLSDNFSSLSYNEKTSLLPGWLYNPETGTVLGKTGSGWTKLLFFYGFFYIFLALFWLGMMSVFIFFVVPTENPLRSGEHSILRLQPGLGIRPMSDHTNLYIRFSVNDPQTYNTYIQSMDTFVDQYYNLNKRDSKLLAECKDGKKEPNDVNKICPFDLTQLADCQMDNKYGYSTKQPCVFIKMNKIYGWLPNPEDSTIPHPILKCDGANPLDTENIGELQYYPNKNFNGSSLGYYDNSYYPYIGQPDYVAPFVAVKFKSLKKNVIVHVSCSLQNIPGLDSTSDIKFEIAMDD